MNSYCEIDQDLCRLCLQVKTHFQHTICIESLTESPLNQKRLSQLFYYILFTWWLFSSEKLMVGNCWQFDRKLNLYKGRYQSTLLRLKPLKNHQGSLCEPESHITCQAKVSHKGELLHISKLEIIYQASMSLDQLWGKS